MPVVYFDHWTNDHYCTNSLSSLHISSDHCTFCTSLHVKTSPASWYKGHPFMTSTLRGEGVKLWCTHVDGGQSPCGRPHRKLKLESTDVILSSSNAKKLVYFLPEFCLWTK